MTKKISKEKQEQLDKLSKKYFWEQKTTEVSMFVLIAIGFLAAFYLLGSIMLMLDPTIEGLFLAGMMGLFFIVVCGAALFLFGLIFYAIIKEWIEDNEEKAERRAKDELGIKYERYSSW